MATGVDSGATAHITHDFNNLAVSSDYSGHEGLMAGNGNLVPISSIDSNFISVSYSSSSDSLLLKNILFVPQITKNLLDISQFTKDNNVIIEFNSDSCFVKDKINHKLLLKGSLSKGLYQLDLAPLLLKDKACFGAASAFPLNSDVPCNSSAFISTYNRVYVAPSLTYDDSTCNNSDFVPKSSIHFAGLCKHSANTLCWYRK